MTIRSLSTLMLLTAILSGCSTTPARQLFLLPDSAFIMPERQATPLGIEIKLAEPIRPQNMLYQNAPNRIELTRNHLWATPLDQAIAATLSNHLNRLQSHYNVAPSTRLSPTDPRLTIYIETFQGSYTGQTHISGYGRYPNGSIRRFDIHTPQQGDGYTAMIESFHQGLEQVAVLLQPSS